MQKATRSITLSTLPENVVISSLSNSEVLSLLLAWFQLTLYIVHNRSALAICLFHCFVLLVKV